MSSISTLQLSSLPQLNATVLDPAGSATGSLSVAQSSQLGVGGSVTWVVVPLTTKLIVRPPPVPLA